MLDALTEVAGPEFVSAALWTLLARGLLNLDEAVTKN